MEGRELGNFSVHAGVRILLLPNFHVDQKEGGYFVKLTQFIIPYHHSSVIHSVQFESVIGCYAHSKKHRNVTCLNKTAPLNV